MGKLNWFLDLFSAVLGLSFLSSWLNKFHSSSVFQLLKYCCYLFSYWSLLMYAILVFPRSSTVALMGFLKGTDLKAWVQFIIFNWKNFSIFVEPSGHSGAGEEP